MDGNRRSLIAWIGRLAIAAPVGLFAAQDPEQMQPTPKRQIPSSPTDQQGSGPDFPAPDPKAILKHNQQQIKKDVEKLYTLASKLKAQVEETDSTSVLSLSLVESTKQIENLAKQIRSLAVD